MQKTFSLLITLLLVSLCLSSSSSLQAQVGQVDMALKRVVVLGLNEQEETIVRQTVPLQIGEPVTEQSLKAMEQLEAKIEAANLSQKLQNIKIRPFTEELATTQTLKLKDWSELELFLDFRLPPSVSEIAIYPLVPVDAEDFLVKLPVAIGQVYSSELDQQLIAALQEQASSKGVIAPNIITNHLLKNDSSISLGFIIEDSSPQILRKIRFRDSGFGNAMKIRAFLKQPEPIGVDKKLPITGDQLLEIQTISGDLMRSLGYLKATGRLDETKVTKKGVKVYYRMDRGPKYHINSITAQGKIFQDPAFWNRTTQRFTGKSISSKRLHDFEKALKRRSYKEGYMAPVIELDFKTINEDEVALTAQIDEGSKSKMGGVIVERQPSERGYGHSWYHRHIAPPLDEALIAKQVRAQPGDDLNLHVLDDTERRLNRLGLFEEVEVDTRATTDTAVRDVVTKVKEARTAGLGASVGWNDQYGAVTRLDFIERNVGGGGDVLGFGGYYAFNEEGFGGNISYTDRYNKFMERMIGKKREPAVTYSANYDEIGYREYTEKRVGGRVRLNYLTGKPLGPWSNTVSTRVEEVTYSPQSDKDDYNEEFNNYLATTAGYNITYDTRNRGEFDSTEGWLLDTGIESGKADGFLAKWLNTAEWNQPISKLFGWQQRGQFGLMPYQADNVGLGERFQNGGLGSIRGFSYRGIGPIDGQNDELHTGGSTMTSLQNEIRVIVTEDVDVPFFLDFGTLENSPGEIGTVRSSAGTGLRIRMPNSRQRAFIYYAEELNSEAKDDGRQIHFGFKFDL